MGVLQETQNFFMGEPKSATIDELLEEIQVEEITDMGKLDGWYAVTNLKK